MRNHKNIANLPCGQQDQAWSAEEHFYLLDLDTHELEWRLAPREHRLQEERNYLLGHNSQIPNIYTGQMEQAKLPEDTILKCAFGSVRCNKFEKTNPSLSSGSSGKVISNSSSPIIFNESSTCNL
jgi:hypothetical protein